MLGLVIHLPVLYFRGAAYTEAPPSRFNSKKLKSVYHWGAARCAMLAALRSRIGINGTAKDSWVRET